MPPSIELSSACASTVGEGTFLAEEADSLSDPRLKAKGNLYIVGEGISSEVTNCIKAIRNQYYGDTSTTTPLDVASALQQSIEASNSLLLRQNAIGVSLVCSVVYDNKLVVMHVGDCKAYLYSGHEGAIEPLTSQANAYAALGTQAKLTAGFAGRILKDKDMIILCSGSLADALREEEVARIVGAGSGEIDPEDVAKRLVSRSNARGEAIGATAIVINCKGAPIAESALTDTTAWRAPTHYVDPTSGMTKKNDNTGSPADSPETPSSSGQMKKVVGIASIVVVALAAFYLGGRGTDIPFLSNIDAVRSVSAITADKTPQSSSSGLGSDITLDSSSSVTASNSTTTGALDADKTWAQIDALWKKGEAGDGDAWQQIVAYLEQLQLQTPGDPKIDEKLGSARINLAYTQKRKEVESYWGNGDVSVSTVSSWSRVVEILESLYRLKLPPDAALWVKDRLYTAHINYGKSLEAGNRPIEAKGQYERASQIYPNRPEAQDALKKLSK